MKRAIVAALVLLFAASGSLMARDVTVDSSKDLWLCAQGSGDANAGTNGKLIYEAGAGDGYVAVAWDLSGITLALGEYVASATIQFYGAGGPSNCSYHLGIYPLKKTWVEGTGSSGFGGTGYPWGPTSVGDACKNYQVVTTTTVATGGWITLATGGTAWQVAGAQGANDAYRDKAMTTGTWTASGINDKAAYTDIPLTATGCDVVEDWIDGGLTNYGLVIDFTDVRSGGSVCHLASREYGTDAANLPGAYAPELIIEILPEPGCMALLGLGTVVLFRRRKRK